jgi:hypothetical protein
VGQQIRGIEWPGMEASSGCMGMLARVLSRNVEDERSVGRGCACRRRLDLKNLMVTYLVLLSDH